MAGQVSILPQMLKNKVARYVDGVLVDINNDPIPVGGGANAYLYKAYASDDSGTGFSLTPSAGLYFVALKRTTSPVESPVAGDFSGLWLDTRGASGLPGASSYKYRAFASAADGADFTLMDNPALAYVAEINVTSPIASPVVGDFAGLFVKRIGTDGASIYKYRAFASAGDGTGFTMTDDPGLDYVAEIITTSPIESPVLVDFAGLFIKRSGTDGAPGAQGDRAGHRYKMGALTVMVNPGAGLLRFNSLLASTTTNISISATAKNSISIALEMATWMINDLLTFKSNVNSGTSIATFQILAISYNAVNGWYNFTVLYINGVRPADNEEIVVNHAICGIRMDAQGNLLDAQGNIRSGMMTGTHAEMLALTAADYENEFFYATDYGIRYRCNGTIWIADGDQLLLDAYINFAYIAPNTQATAISDNGGGKVRITANTHLLDTANAVTAAIPFGGAKVDISTWTGTGIAGFYNILAVATNTIDIDLAYNAGLGIPTIVLKNVEVTIPYTFTLPPLNNNSTILYESEYVYTASVNSKFDAMHLGGTKLSRKNNNVANIVFSKAFLGFRNTGSKTVQESIHGEGSNTGSGGTTTAQATSAIDTGSPSVMSFRIQPAVANELIVFKHLTVRLRG